MKKRIFPVFLLSGLFLLFYWLIQAYFPDAKALQENAVTPRLSMEAAKAIPNDWVYRQRAYPSGQLDVRAYQDAAKQHHSLRLAAEKTTSGVWEAVGPDNISGRVTSIEVSPSNPMTIFLGAASGGVFKSTDGGSNFSPVFDNESFLSIGDIALAPSQSGTVYVGTGEANGAANSGAFPGNGVYKSIDDGATWNHMGLDSTEQIGRIAVDPNDPDRVFVAAMGRQYGRNTHRGVYRSTDGGFNWQQVLFVNDTTGAVDVIVDPQAPANVLAVTWTRLRYPDDRSYAGPGSGVWKSTDGGDTWARLSLPALPGGADFGRIGLCQLPSAPNKIWVSVSENKITNDLAGIYHSTDYGNTWTSLNYPFGAHGGFGWYFGQIRVNPNDPLNLFVLGVELNVSTDGGNSWNPHTGNVHADQHDLVFHPTNPSVHYLGNDGGFYSTTNNGTFYAHNDLLPITQFYQTEIHPTQPGIFLGGTQDNGTLRNGVPPGPGANWERIFYGDGFYTIVHPFLPNIIFAEYQRGNIHKSTDNGYTWYPSDFGIDRYDRFNWNSPFIMDPGDPNVMYFGTQRLYKSTDNGDSWFPISNDLTNGPGTGALNFGTLTTIAVSDANFDQVYVGSDDGNVAVTTNAGATWTNISANLPDLYVTRVFADEKDEDICYVTFSGFEYEDYQPHIFKTTDAGASWTDISGNLPRGPVNDVIADPAATDVLYIATDFGVMYTTDGGTNWQPFGAGLPTVSVFDLDFDPVDRLLIAGTYGRSMYKIDVNSIVTEAKEPTAVGSGQLKIGPNPATTRTAVHLELTQSQMGHIEVFDLQGRQVQSLPNQTYPAGKQQLDLDVHDLEQGNYIVRFVSDKQVFSGKLSILR